MGMLGYDAEPLFSLGRSYPPDESELIPSNEINAAPDQSFCLVAPGNPR
jgi:hypothetical protein